MAQTKSKRTTRSAKSAAKISRASEKRTIFTRDPGAEARRRARKQAAKKQ